MKKGMIFDWFEEGNTAKRVMALSDNSVMDLGDMAVYYDIDFENEVEEVLIDNIFEYGK